MLMPEDRQGGREKREAGRQQREDGGRVSEGKREGGRKGGNEVHPAARVMPFARVNYQYYIISPLVNLCGPKQKRKRNGGLGFIFQTNSPPPRKGFYAHSRSLAFTLLPRS